MLTRRTLAGVVGWWRHVAPRRFDLSSARIVVCSMWAIVAGFQEARLSLALTMGCRKWFCFTFCCCCFGIQIFVWISRAQRCNCICFCPDPFYVGNMYYVGQGPR